MPVTDAPVQDVCSYCLELCNFNSHGEYLEFRFCTACRSTVESTLTLQGACRICMERLRGTPAERLLELSNTNRESLCRHCADVIPPPSPAHTQVEEEQRRWALNPRDSPPPRPRRNGVLQACLICLNPSITNADSILMSVLQPRPFPVHTSALVTYAVCS